jgi:hypothetical protein
MKPDRIVSTGNGSETTSGKWQQDGRWIEAGSGLGSMWHLMDGGYREFLIALMEEPEWVKDVFATYLDSCISHFEMIWDAGYRFDSITWQDDMVTRGHHFSQSGCTESFEALS